MIYIFQLERCEEYSLPFTNDFILQNNDSRFIPCDNEENILSWINSIQDNDIVIFTLYDNPFDILGEVLKRIKEKQKNIKIYFTGPLAVSYPDEVLEYFKTGEIIYNNSLPFITDKFYQIVDKDFYMKNYLKLKEKSVVNLILSSDYHCENNCSYCFKSKKNHRFQYDFKLLPQDYLEISDKIQTDETQCKLLCSDIFCCYSLENINLLIENLSNKFKRIYTWANSKNILKHQEFINSIDTKECELIFNVGIESFDKEQLERYNKNYLEFNNKLYDAIQTEQYNKNIKFEILFLLFEPMVSTNQILINYQKMIDINRKKNILCNYSCPSLIFFTRYWRPVKGTVLFNKYEKYLKKGMLTPIETYPQNNMSMNSEQLPWRFENKECEKIFDFMCNLGSQIESKVKTIITPDKMSLCYKCGGTKRVYDKEYNQIDQLVVEYIQTRDEGIPKSISKIIDEIAIDIKKKTIKYAQIYT